MTTGHWLIGMGHGRATSIQSAIGDAVFQITGKRFRDLPYGQTRSDLELRVTRIVEAYQRATL